MNRAAFERAAQHHDDAELATHLAAIDRAEAFAELIDDNVTEVDRADALTLLSEKIETCARDICAARLRRSGSLS